jgi:hypothetical protein
MLHACLCTIYFVFCYTSWCFYVFSGTNLLTRCHSVSSLFSAIFVFQKSYTGNILGIGRNKKLKFLFFSTRDGVQSRDGGGAEGSHAIGWRGPPPGHATRWCGLLVHPLTLSFRLYILLDKKTLRARTLFHKTYCKSPPSSTRDREGPEALPGTVSEREITTGGLLHHHACLQSDVWVVYLGLRVHSSS